MECRTCHSTDVVLNPHACTGLADARGTCNCCNTTVRLKAKA